jgi:hypothetical protein
MTVGWGLRPQQLLTTHMDAVKKVAELLLKQETISQHDIVQLIGPRPYKSDVSVCVGVIFCPCVCAHMEACRVWVRGCFCQPGEYGRVHYRIQLGSKW